MRATSMIERVLGRAALALILTLGGGAALAEEVDSADPTAARELAADPAVARALALERDIQEAFARVKPAFVVVSGGSGVIIAPEGWVLTNHHVVAGRSIGERWWLRRPGGEAVIAKLIGRDSMGDIALLKIDADEPLPFAPLGDSEALRIGDLALALGNPYGFAWDARPTATLGIISAVHSYQQNYFDAIQTDAPINPGNSGGPLLNLRGEVVGINGRVAVRHGNRMNTGVGYAIPAHQIRRFLPRLKEGGEVLHGQVGGLRVRNASPGGTGALVARVDDGGSAAAAGLRRGDRIVAVEGRPVTSATSYLSAIGTYPDGETVTLAVIRGDSRMELAALLEPVELPRPSAERTGARLGVRLAPAEEGQEPGARVLQTEPESAAAEAGIEPGDLITAVDGAEILTNQDLIERIGAYEPGDEIEITLLREGVLLTLQAKLGDWQGGR